MSTGLYNTRNSDFVYLPSEGKKKTKQTTTTIPMTYSKPYYTQNNIDIC